MTYNEAYNKIIDAYFKDEIKPQNPNFCFCGSLCGSDRWNFGDKLYTLNQYEKMERALILELINSPNHKVDNVWQFIPSKKYEDALFKGMSAALDVLKEIHRSRGENVDEGIVFKKRELHPH